MIFRKKRKVFRKKLRFSFNPKKIIFVFSIVFLILITFVFLKVTKISKVEVFANNAPCIDTKYIKSSSLILGKNTFKLKTNEVIRDLRKKYFCIKDIQLKKSGLNSINLKVSGRNPALVLNLIPEEKLNINNSIFKDLNTRESTDSAEVQASASALIRQQLNFDIEQSSISGQLIVDKEGFIFERKPFRSEARTIYDKNNVTDSPLVVYGFFGSVDIGKNIDKRIVENTLEVSNKLQEWNIEPGRFKIVLEKYLLLKVLLPESEDSKRVQIVFNLKEDILRQLASLQLILQKTRIDLKKVESVDLRFEKPVVIYSNQKNGKG